MYISENINGLDSTPGFRYNRKKQDKRLSNHHSPLCIPQQKKHHYGDPRYATSKWYSINFQWVFGVHIIGRGVRGGVESTKLLRMLNLPWQGFDNKTFTEIEAYAGMEERMVRGLVIEEALQPEIKETL